MSDNKEPKIKRIDVADAIRIVSEAGLKATDLSRSYSLLMGKMDDQSKSKQQFCADLEAKFQEWESIYNDLVNEYEEVKRINRALLIRCRFAEKRTQYKNVRKTVRRFEERNSV